MIRLALTVMCLRRDESPMPDLRQVGVNMSGLRLKDDKIKYRKPKYNINVLPFLIVL